MVHLFLNSISLKVRRIEALFIPFILFFLLSILIPALLVLVYAFYPPIIPKFSIFTSNIFYSLALSMFTAICAFLITFIISFPISLLIWNRLGELSRKKIILLLSFPLISNHFIKLIGLKSLLDFINGRMNSTYGIGYTIFGIVYLSLPLITYNFVTSLRSLPKHRNWVLKDLGYTHWGELYFSILPWLKPVFFSSSVLFFLPSVFTTYISEFLNHDSSSQLIGEVISSIAPISNTSSHTKFHLSFLISILFIIAVLSLGLLFIFFKAINVIVLRSREKINMHLKLSRNKSKSRLNFVNNENIRWRSDYYGHLPRQLNM